MQPGKKKGSPLLIGTGACLVLVLAYYCAAGMRPGETIFLWQERMKLILEQPFAWYVNSYTGKIMLLFLFLYTLAVLMYLTGKRNYLLGREMGSAQYADVRKVNRRLSDRNRDKNDPSNILVLKRKWKK